MTMMTAGVLAIGATAGMMLEQRFGDQLMIWCWRHLGRWRRPF